MTSPRTAILLTVVLNVGFLSGCDVWGGGSEIDEDVTSFVDAENLPDAQTPQIRFDDSDSEVTAFLVEFGPGCDCPSGCFYSTGWGLAVRDRIGWMAVRQAFCLEDSVRSDATFFEVQPGDSLLFSPDFRDRFRKATEEEDPDGHAPIYEVFLQMLGRDEDTPVRTLRALTKLLFDPYLPDLADALIQNPVVRSETAILRRLTELPDARGYRPVKEEAEELLDE
jgi:hypothetical protein